MAKHHYRDAYPRPRLLLDVPGYGFLPVAGVRWQSVSSIPEQIVHKVIGGGVMIQHVAIVLSVLCLAFSGVRVVSAKVSYTVTDLGTLPGGAYGGASCISNSGYVAGAGNSANSSNHAFLYSNGTMTDLGTLPAVPTVLPLASMTVGKWRDGVLTPPAMIAPVLYSNGTMTDLGTLPGHLYSYAWGVNNRGQVAGAAQHSVPSPGGSGGNRAFLYSGGTMTDLGTARRRLE